MVSIHTGCTFTPNQFKWLSLHSENGLFIKWLYEGKKLELRIWSQQWLLWRFIAMDNVNIPPCLIISAAEATVGQDPDGISGYPPLFPLSFVKWVWP